MRLVAWSVLAAALALQTLAQSRPFSTKEKDHGPIAPEVPTRRLEFKAEPPIPGVTASPVVMLPTQCTSDGTLFLEMMQPPDFMKSAVLAISEKKGRTFKIGSAADLHDAQAISMFPSDAMLAFLVRAYKQSSLGSGQAASARQQDYRYYVARFNLDGSYKESIELALHNFPPSHLAVLNSGKFLVSGFDRADASPRLLLLDSDGAILRRIPLPEGMGDSHAPADSTSEEGVVATGKLMGSIMFTSYRDQVLVWRAGVRAPILEVNPDGGTRELDVETPRGLLLSDVIPSSGNLLLHYRPARLAPDAPVNAKDSVYYELRAADGSLASRLKLEGDPPPTIACESGGSYIAFQTDNGAISRLVAR